MSKSQWLPDDKQTGNFSNGGQDTFDPGKGYVGIRLQQGVPLLDRDWNELEDIRRYAEVILRKHYIGNGTPDDGFKISALEPPANDFKISKGRCLVDGFEVVNAPVDENGNEIEYILYLEQGNVASLTVPTNNFSDSPRPDIVYLDVWIEEIKSVNEKDVLRNPQDVNMETCIRHQLNWRVKVDEGNPRHSVEEKHYYYDIAEINRAANDTAISENMIKDLRRTKLAFDKHNHSKLVAPDGAPDPALSVDNNGNVGIGTESPVAKLQIEGGTEAKLAGGGFLVMGSTSEENIVIDTNEIMARKNGSKSELHLQAGGGELIVHKWAGGKFIVDDNGNVGIGTTEPGAQLSLGKWNSGDAGASDDGAVQLLLSGLHNVGVNKGGQNGTYKLKIEGYNNEDGFVVYPIYCRDENDKVDFWIKNKPNENGLPTMYFAGNVGIGTFNPEVKLQIEGGKNAELNEGGLLVLGSTSEENIVIDNNEIMARKNKGKSALNLQAKGGELIVHLKETGKEFIVDDNGNMGIGTVEPKNKLDVDGGAVIGTGYSGTDTAPQNGLLVEGNVGIGTTSPQGKLDVNGSIYAGNSDIYFTKTDHNPVGEGNKKDCAAIENSASHKALMILGRTVSTNPLHRVVKLYDYLQVNGSLDVTGNLGIGTVEPKNKLDVKGGAVIGSGYSGTNTAPQNGLLVEGNVGIATESPVAKLQIVGREDAGLGEGKNGLLVLGSTSEENIVIDNNEIMARKNGLSSELHLQADGGALIVHQFADGKFIVDVNGNVGIGILKPLYTLHTNGTSFANKRISPGGDYAEYFESKNGKEIEAGTAVILDNGKIRPTKKGETPIGIISANPQIAGGVPIEWPKKYLKDEFGNQIMEEYKEEIMIPRKEKVKKERRKTNKKKITEKVKRTEIVQKKGKYCQVEIEETIEHEEEEPFFKEVDLYDASGKKKIGKHQVPVMETYEEEIDVLDDKGQPVLIGSGKFETKTRPKINPEYDETKEYIPREKRPEWNCVGLLGQLPLRKEQPVAPTWVKIKDISQDVELWLVR